MLWPRAVAERRLSEHVALVSTGQSHMTSGQGPEMEMGTCVYMDQRASGALTRERARTRESERGACCYLEGQTDSAMASQMSAMEPSSQPGRPAA